MLVVKDDVGVLHAAQATMHAGKDTRMAFCCWERLTVPAPFWTEDQAFEGEPTCMACVDLVNEDRISRCGGSSES